MQETTEQQQMKITKCSEQGWVSEGVCHVMIWSDD